MITFIIKIKNSKFLSENSHRDCTTESWHGATHHYTSLGREAGGSQGWSQTELHGNSLLQIKDRTEKKEDSSVKGRQRRSNWGKASLGYFCFLFISLQLLSGVEVRITKLLIKGKL